MRWVVTEALTHGAPVAHVAAALGLASGQLAVGLRSWANGRHKHAGMSAAARDEIHALRDDPEVGG